MGVEIGVKFFSETRGTRMKRVKLDAMRSAGLKTVLPGDQFQELTGITFQHNATDYRFATPQRLEGKMTKKALGPEHTTPMP